MWFYIALATSFISAISVVLNKRILKGVDPSVLTWFTLVLSTPLIAVFAYKEGVPVFNAFFLVGVFGSVFFYVIAKIIHFRAIKISNLSAIYPLVSIGPIFTLLFGYLPPLSERPGFISLIGVLITLVGTYVLNVSNVKEGLLKPFKVIIKNKAALLIILSVIVESAIIFFDKLAMNNTIPKNPTFTLFAENAFVIVGLLPILFLKTQNFSRQIFNHKKLFVILGVLNAISTVLAFSAVSSSNIGVVSAVFKAQMLFVLLLSYIFFKDRPKLETLIGSTIMILGVVLIKVGS